MVTGKFGTDIKLKACIFNSFFAEQCKPLKNDSVLPVNQIFLTQSRLISLDFNQDGIQGRIQRFWKEEALYVGHHGWPTKKILDFRWSKKAKITLEAISFWRNISISIFKFSRFLYTMKAYQWDLILVLNITHWQNVYAWRLIKVNYKRSL